MKRLRGHLDDLLFGVALLCIVTGVALIYLPAALIVLGAGLAFLALGMEG